jgi:hypothetical protein
MIYYIKLLKYEKNSNQKNQDLMKDNLLEEEELKKSKKNLSKEIVELINRIKIQRQEEKNNLKIKKKLTKKR